RVNGLDVEDAIAAGALGFDAGAEVLDGAVADRHVIESTRVVDPGRPATAGRDPAEDGVAGEVDVDAVGSDDQPGGLRAVEAAGQPEARRDRVPAAVGLGGEPLVRAAARAALLRAVLRAEPLVVGRRRLEAGN